MEVDIKTKLRLAKALTNVSVAYLQKDDEFLADKVFPSVPVEERSDVYYQFDSSQYLQSNVEQVAPKGQAPIIDITLASPVSYYCPTVKLAVEISTEKIREIDKVQNVEKVAAKTLARNFLIKREREFAKAFFTKGLWQNDVDGVENTANSQSKFNFWSNQISSPIQNIKEIKSTIHLRTTLTPNTAILGYNVFDALLEHKEIIARIIHSGSNDNPAKASINVLKNLFELDNIYISKAVHNLSPKGNFNVEGNSYVCDPNSALICYVPPEAGLEVPASGYTFEYTGVQESMFAGNSFNANAGNGSVGTKRYYDERKSCYVVETWEAYNHKLVGKELGFFLSNIVKKDK